MNSDTSKRQFMTFGSFDTVTDIVCDSNGKEYVVTMRGWHWNNLDWIKKNSSITEGMLVSNSIIALAEEKQIPLEERGHKGELTLSLSLEATIYFFIEGYDTARKERLAKRSKDGKDFIGSA